ncbi:hypothetical protein [Streptomyces platensis]|uniref:hypothetical protein n=1 Tax=Streptomyces platensis TaxID=58346 RepID=UPI002E25ECAC
MMAMLPLDSEMPAHSQHWEITVLLAQGLRKAPTTPSALHPVHNDERAEGRVLAHSSRIYDALRAPYAPEQDSRARTVNDSVVTYAGAPSLVAFNAEDQTVAQIAPSSSARPTAGSLDA